MRITGGLARGINLKSPAGKDTRPATDAMREALFSSLGDSVVDSHWCDLFAGCGCYGLEALSRGAKSCDFVEASRPACGLLEQNLKAVLHSIQTSGGECRGKVHCTRVESYLKGSLSRSLDFIIADPPYESGQQIFSLLENSWSAIIDPESPPVLIWECPGNEDLESPVWEEVKRIGKKKHGPSLRLLKWKSHD